MKTALSLLAIICLVVPAAGQSPSPANPPSANPPTVAVDPTTNDPTMNALTALLEAKTSHTILADKELLLRVKAEADRPNYGGNAAARTHKNHWLSILQGKVKPDSSQRGKSGR